MLGGNCWERDCGRKSAEKCCAHTRPKDKLLEPPRHNDHLANIEGVGIMPRRPSRGSGWALLSGSKTSMIFNMPRDASDDGHSTGMLDIAAAS